MDIILRFNNNPINNKIILGSHIDRAGSICPLSAKFSPPIKNAQYIRKNIKLIAILIENFPRFAIIPNGAPTRTNTIPAIDKENFL